MMEQGARLLADKDKFDPLATLQFDHAFERALRGALPSAIRRIPSIGRSISATPLEPHVPTHNTYVPEEDPAHRPVRLCLSHGRSKSAFLSLPAMGRAGVRALNLRLWLRAGAEVVVGCPWRSFSSSALFAAPRSLIAQHKWTQARELMCDLCFLSEYMHTFGPDRILDLFEIARIAAAIDRNNEAAATFGIWERFAKRLPGEGKVARLGYLIQLAQQESEATSVRDAAHALLDSVRACISLTEASLMKSPPKKTNRGLSGYRALESHTKVEGRDTELENAVKTLQAFYSLGGTESLSRPWRARLFACCDATCTYLGQALDHNESQVNAQERAVQSANQQQLRHCVHVSHAGTQRDVVESVMELMRERKSCTVRLVGAAGCGISSLLAVCAGMLEQLFSNGGRVVYLCKMAWHSDQQFMRLFMRELVQDDGGRADRMSVHDALRQLDTSRRLFLVLDGLTPEEQDMVSSANLYSGSECIVSVVMAGSTPRNEEGGTDEIIAVKALSRPEKHAILKARAADLGLHLSREELEVIACKEGANSPQYLVFALHYIKLRRDAKYAVSWVDHLPSQTVDLFASDGGLLAYVEQAHGFKLVTCVSECLVHFSMCSCLDILRLGHMQGFDASVEGVTAAVGLLHAFGCISAFALPPMSPYQFYAMRSKNMRTAMIERYGLGYENGLEIAGSYWVALKHISFETNSKNLRHLLRTVSLLPDTARISRVRELLEAEDALTCEPSFRVMLELESRCSELTGSLSIQTARRAIEIRQQLPAVLDIGLLSALVADFQVHADCEELKFARRILALHEQLALEKEYSGIVNLMDELQAFSGSTVISRGKEVLECISKIQIMRDLPSLKELLQKVKHVTGHPELDRMRHVVEIEGKLTFEKSIPKLADMLEQCDILENTVSMLAAQEVLRAEAALRNGVSDLASICEYLNVCSGMLDSDALDIARCAVDAVEALRSCRTASSKSIKLLLGKCDFVTGCTVLEQARRKVELHQSLEQWIPFTLIKSMACKIGEVLGKRSTADINDFNLVNDGDDETAARGKESISFQQRVQDLFSEFDTDKSGYIDREEMEAAFERMGVRLTEHEMKNLMFMADEDGTGEIDVLEFSHLIVSMLARLDSIKSEQHEIQKISCIMQELEGEFMEHPSNPHEDDAQAIREARFKMQLHNLSDQTDFDTIRKFFSEYQVLLDIKTFAADHVLEKKGWLASEERIRSLLKTKSSGTPLVIAKRDLWEAVKNCGMLTGSLALGRAKRILEAENQLMCERRVNKLAELLQLCGVLHGSPAVLNAQRLVDAESALVALIDGIACCTIPEIQSAVSCFNDVQNSVAIEKARAIIICEAVLENETRSPIIRRILAICECVRDSRIIDRSRFWIRTESSIAVNDSQPPEWHQLDEPFDFMITEHKRHSLEVARAESLESLRGRVRKVEVPILRLSLEITDANMLWDVLQRCDGLTESPVLAHATQIIEALELLPWTRDLESMLLIKQTIIKEVGGEFQERARMRAKLTLIFEAIDVDRSGNLDKFKIDNAFFGLGVNLLPGDLDLLFEKYDTNQSGTVCFDEFEAMTIDLMRGTKWTNSRESSDIRGHLQVCGHIRSGILTDRIETVFSWISAEDKLVQGISSYKDLDKVAKDCGALSGSAILDQSIKILMAADEVKYAKHSEVIQDLISICGHLDGPQHMLERKKWLEAEQCLRSLNYEKEPQEWLATPYRQLCEIVENCGGLEQCVALENATKVLKAEAQLSIKSDAPSCTALLKICGHLTDSVNIASRRSSLQARNALLGTRDIARLKELLKECSQLEPCYMLTSIQELLDLEARLKEYNSEETMRMGISILSARISGSKNLSDAMKRYGKFQRYRQALHVLETSTDATILTRNFRTFALRFLFDRLDPKKKCCVSFSHLAQAIVALGIEPRVDAKKATNQIFPAIVSDKLIVFVHLAFDLEFQKRTDTTLDSDTISDALYKLEIVNTATLTESVLDLSAQGGPDEPIHFEAFDDFISDQLSRTSCSLAFLRSLIPDDLVSPQIQTKMDWLFAMEEMNDNDNFDSLQSLLIKCGELTGSKRIEQVRAMLKAADLLQYQTKRENIVELLGICGHLKECQSVSNIKRILAYEDSLERVANLAQLKFLVHSCRNQESDLLQKYRQVLHLHDQFEIDLLRKFNFPFEMQLPDMDQFKFLQDAFSGIKLEDSRLMSLIRFFNKIKVWIETIKQLINENEQASAAEDAMSLLASNLKVDLMKTLLNMRHCSPRISFLSNSCFVMIAQWDEKSWVSNLNHGSEPMSQRTAILLLAENKYDERHRAAAIKIQSRQRGIQARRTVLLRQQKQKKLSREERDAQRLGPCDILALLSTLESLKYEVTCFCHDICGKNKASCDEWPAWCVAFDEHSLLQYWKVQLQDFLGGYEGAPDYRLLAICTRLLTQRGYWADLSQIVCNLFYIRARIECEGVSALLQDLDNIFVQATQSLQCTPEILLKLQAYIWVLRSNETDVAEGSSSLLHLCINSFATSTDPDQSVSSFTTGQHVFVPTPRGQDEKIADLQEFFDGEEELSEHGALHLPKNDSTLLEYGQGASTHLLREDSTESISSLGSNSSKQSKLSKASKGSKASSLSRSVSLGSPLQRGSLGTIRSSNSIDGLFSQAKVHRGGPGEGVHRQTSRFTSSVQSPAFTARSAFGCQGKVPPHSDRNVDLFENVDDLDSWAEGEIEGTNTGSSMGLQLLSTFIAQVRGDALAIRDQALNFLESIGAMEEKLKKRGTNSDGTFFADVGSMLSKFRFLRNAKLLGLMDVAPDRKSKLNLDNVLGKEWSGLTQIKAYGEEVQTEKLLSEHLELIAQKDQLEQDAWRPGKSFLAFEDVIGGVTSGDVTRAILSFSMNSDERTGSDQYKTDYLLISSLARVSGHPRSLIKVLSTSGNHLTVELFGAESLVQTVKKVRAQAKEPKSELRKLCPILLGNAQTERQLIAVRLGIFVLDAPAQDHTEEMKFLQTFVLPAVRDFCIRESLNVHFEWDLFSKEEFVSQIALFSSSDISHGDTNMTWAPINDGIATQNRTPYFLILAGHSNENSHKRQALVGQTQNETSVQSSAEENRNITVPSFVDDTIPFHEKLPCDWARPEKLFLLSSGQARAESNLVQETSPVHDKQAPSSGEEAKGSSGDAAATTQGHHPESDKEKEQPLRTPGAVQRTGRTIPLRRTASDKSMMDSPDAYQAWENSQDVERNVPQEAKALISPDVRQYFKGQLYPTNWKTTENLMVEKYYQGKEHDTLYRLAHFGHQVFNSITSSLVERYPTIVLDKSFHEYELYSQRAHQQQLRHCVHVSHAGTQHDVVESVMGLMRERKSCTVRLVGAAGCGISSLLALCADMLEQLFGGRQKDGGRVVYLCKMAWHSDQQFMRLFMRELVQDDGGRADRMSVHDALRQLDTSRRLFLVLDGLTPEEQDMVSSANLYSGSECIVSVVMAGSTPRNEEGGTDEIIAVKALSRPEKHAILKARAADLGLHLSREELEVIACKEGANSPQYLVFALHYIKLLRDAAPATDAQGYRTRSMSSSSPQSTVPARQGHDNSPCSGGMPSESSHAAAYRLKHLPVRTTDLVADDGGLLAFLEELHGQDFIRSIFYWLGLVPFGLSLTDLQAMVLSQRGDSIGWRGNFNLSARCTHSDGFKSFVGLIHDLSGWIICQTSYNSIRQALYLLSSPLVVYAVAKRYRFYQLDNCDYIDAAIKSDILCSTVHDAAALHKYASISSGFEAGIGKNTTLSWLAAERLLGCEKDFSQLTILAQNCGQLKRSQALDKTLASFDVVAKLRPEIDVRKMRELLAKYEIVAKHEVIEDARRILKKVYLMRKSRNLYELKNLYGSVKKFVGSPTIEWVSKMLQAQQDLPNATTCMQLRRGVAICGGLIECPNLDQALEVLATIEHIRLRSNILKQDLKHLLPYVDKHIRASVERLFVEETKAKVKVKKLTWRTDSSCLVAAVNAGTCDGLIVDTVMENLTDPGPLYELWWGTFDEIVSSLQAARRKAAMASKEAEGQGTLNELRIEEDGYNELQMLVQTAQHITDVEEIHACLRAMEALQALETAKSLTRINELFTICGHIKSNNALEQFREVLVAHESLDTERDIRKLKKFLSRCQWIEGSDKIEYAKLVVQGITDIQEKYGITSGAKHSLPAQVLFEFIRTRAKYTGSECVEAAFSMSQAIAQLEMDGDEMRWTNMLMECSKDDTNPRPLFLHNEWDIAQVSHILATCGHVTDEIVVARANQWYQSIFTVTSACTPKIQCGWRQLSTLVKNCGPLNGNLTVSRVIDKMLFSHTGALSAEQKDLLPVFLREYTFPKSEMGFLGWSDLMRMLDLSSGRGDSVVNREDSRFFSQAITLVRARNAVDAIEELQSEAWPRDVERLRRLIADCERLQAPILETFISVLDDIDALNKTQDVKTILKAIESAQELTGSVLLDKARAQHHALICLEQERNKYKLEVLVATCENVKGSHLLDRARKWIVAEAKLEGPLRAEEYGLVTMEKGFAEMQRLTLECGDMQGSLVLDEARHLLDMCQSLDTIRDATALRRTVDYLVSHGVTGCPAMDATLHSLEREACLPGIVDVIELIRAVIEAEERLSGSMLVEAANQRIMTALTTGWRKLFANSSQAILTKLVPIGRSLNSSVMRNSVDCIDEFGQALSDIEFKLQAVTSLQTETQYSIVMDLLAAIGDIEGTHFLARARMWREAVKMLSLEEDATRIRELVLQCVEMSGSDVLDKAREKVKVLDTIEALPELSAGNSEHYHVSALSYYCRVCPNVTGHTKMTVLQDAYNAVNEIEAYNALETMEEFPKFWYEVAGPNIATTANQIWQLVESLTKQSEMSVLQDLLAKLDTINATQHMLDELFASVTSEVPKTSGFTLVTTEPWHVTISNQAHSLQRIVAASFFVEGSSRIVRARQLVGFFTVQNEELCAGVQRMPEVYFKLCSGEVGQQMIGLILFAQGALMSGPYQYVKQAVASNRKLLGEKSFPKILRLCTECMEHTPLIFTEARNRAANLTDCEKKLSEEHGRRFEGSSYVLLKHLTEQMEGIRDCPVLDAARYKLKLIDDLEKIKDYLVIRDLVPHVDMIQECPVVQRAKHVVACVREMISTKNVSRLRTITDDPTCQQVTGIPDFERIKDLLTIEASLNDLHSDVDTLAALGKLGTRFDASKNIKRARDRVRQLKRACATSKVFDVFSAASFGDAALIKYYLDSGATVHSRNHAGETPLMHACKGGWMEAVLYLLESGGRLTDLADNGYNCLHFAACAGHLELVHELVPRMCWAAGCGVSINATVSALKCTALHLAAKHGHGEVAYFLMQNNGAAEAGDANGNTALLCALGSNQAHTAAFLIECGCNVKACNTDHYTTLHLAAKYGHVHIAKMCVEAGVDANARTRAGLTAMHMAALGAHLEMCFWLIHRQNNNINVCDNRGFTPLHHAASGGNLEVVKMLLSYGANPHLLNYVARGYLAVDIAKNDAVVSLLSKYMAMPETKSRLEHEAKLRYLIYSCEELCDHTFRIKVSEADSQSKATSLTQQAMSNTTSGSFKNVSIKRSETDLMRQKDGGVELVDEENGELEGNDDMNKRMGGEDPQDTFIRTPQTGVEIVEESAEENEENDDMNKDAGLRGHLRLDEEIKELDEEMEELDARA